jgi:hypothetical protein
MAAPRVCKDKNGEQNVAPRRWVLKFERQQAEVRFARDSPLEQERFEPPVPLPDLGRSGAFEICSILVLVEAHLLVAINSGTNVGAHGCTDEH